MDSSSTPDTRSSAAAVHFALILSCFFLSGWAALVYQTVWMRQFAVVFGTSELAISTVLSAYMLGLALGAILASRWAAKVQSPILVYGVLELGIAIGALVVPFGLRFAQTLQQSVIGHQVTLPDAGGLAQPLFYTGVAFVLLMIPTTCMGATLPLLTRSVIFTDEQIGRRVGLLYSVNTLGAVFGTLMAGYLILPFLGLFETTCLAVLANLAVFGLATWLERSAKTSSTMECIQATLVSPRSSAEVTVGACGWILPLMFISGMVSFTYEVMWSRLLGHLIGGSVYAFATMLATFLTGITLGSAIASRFANRRTQATWGFALAQWGTAAMAICMYLLLDRIPGWADRIGAGASTGTELWGNSLLCSAVLLPSTICIGATFPFAVRIFAGSAADAGAASGRVYAWNTFGCVAGALLAGYWIVPALEYRGTIYFAVACNLGLAMAGSLMAVSSRWQLKFTMAGACLLLLVSFWPQTPHTLLACSPLVVQDEGNVIFHKVGRSSTVRLTDGNGYYMLQNNGLPEALISTKGTPHFGGSLQRWLSALPIIARSNADSMLVIGFGGGTAVDNVPASVKRIDVIELEKEVIAANQQIARFREFDPLSDPRVNVVLNDARGALSLSDRKYDIIVSQPSHPWTAGASHLYTREFLRLSKEHLTEGGVMLQWLSSDFIDEELFKVMGATVLSEFEYVRLYQPNSTALYFLASDKPLALEESVVETGEPLTSAVRQYSRLPINGMNDLLATLTLDTTALREICADTTPNTDNRNRLAFESAPTKRIDEGESLQRFLGAHAPLLNRDWLADRETLQALFIPELVVRRMCTLGMWQRATDLAEAAPNPAQQQLLRAVISHSLGNVEDTRKLLRGVLRLNPDHEDAKFLLCEQFLNEFLQVNVPADVEQVYGTLSEPYRAVLDATIAMQRSEFAKMAQLDSQLAQIPRDSLTYVFALYARAAWRAVPLGDSQEWVRGREALELVDRAMAIWVRNSGYMIRLNAAMLADNPDATLETIRHYARQLATAKSPSGQREALHTLPRLQRITAKYARDPRLDGKLIRQIDQYLQQSLLSLTPSPPSTESVIVPVNYQTEN